MKLIRLQKLLPLFFLFLVILVGCKKDDNPTESTNTNTIVGTWKLTKIIANVSGANLELTPDQAGIQATITAGADGTYKATTTEAGVTTNYTGTYKIIGNKLEVKFSDGTSETTEFTINSTGNKLTIKREIEAFGTKVPATLEFTKQ